MNTEQNNKIGSITKGIGFVLLAHVIYCVFCWYYDEYYDSAGVLFFFFAWLIQFIYVIPMAMYFLVKKEKQTLKGTLIASGITFFLGVLFCIGCILIWDHRECGNEIIETQISPDKKYRLLIFKRACGQDHSTEISILKKNEELKDKEGNVFTAITDDFLREAKDDDVIKIRTKWLNNKTVLVEYEGKAKTENFRKGIKIVYKTL